MYPYNIQSKYKNIKQTYNNYSYMSKRGKPNNVKIAKHNVLKSNENRRGKDTIKIPCGDCGKILYITKYNQNRYKRFYCDRRCETNHRSFKTMDEAIVRSKRYIDKNGYAVIHFAGRGWLLHRVIMERHLNKRLKRAEHVHHINGVKDDNRIENLMVVLNKKHSTETNKKVLILQKKIRELENELFQKK